MENLSQKSPLKASDVSPRDSLQNNSPIPASVSSPAAGFTEKLAKLYVHTRSKKIKSLLALS